jgi:hypothetical protein
LVGSNADGDYRSDIEELFKPVIGGIIRLIEEQNSRAKKEHQSIDVRFHLPHCCSETITDKHQCSALFSSVVLETLIIYSPK